MRIQHPLGALIQAKLAYVKREQGVYAGAEEMLTHSLRIKEAQLGADYPDTAITLHQLGASSIVLDPENSIRIFPGSALPVTWPFNRKTEVPGMIAAKGLRQQGNGIKRDGQTSPARDHRAVVG